MTIPKPDDELNVRELITIRNFRDLHEALLAKGSLESSGIESFLADENMVHMDWLISNLLGGVKLKVDAANAEAAVEILDRFNSEEITRVREALEPPDGRVLPFKKPLKFD